MIKISCVRNPSHCEHCGTSITNVYVIREIESEFLIRVGSTCLRNVLLINEKGQNYLAKESAKAMKHLAHKERIRKALESGDREKLIKSFGNIYWQEDKTRTIENTAKDWMQILQYRFEYRMNELSDMYKNVKIREKRTVEA